MYTHPQAARRLPLAALALATLLGLLATPLASAGPLGFIMMRVYLPEGGFGTVELPTLVFEHSDGTRRELAPCSRLLQVSTELLKSLADRQPDCGWALSYGDPDRISLNVAAPDTAAAYWVTPFMPVATLRRITINGRFPDARYLSFITYDAGFDPYFPMPAGMQPQLTDFEIVPDAGFLNPWQQPALAGGRYTLYVARSAADAPRNALAMPPARDGSLVDILGRMPTIANCAPVCLPYHQFFRPGTELQAGFAPNEDSGYLFGLMKPLAGTVMVIRGKLPPVADGNNAEPWLSSGRQLRYMSICAYPVVKPYPVTGCVRDDQLELDGAGYYTVVVGGLLDQPLSMHWRRDNWIPWSTLFPLRDHLLLLRNMVEQDGFNRSAMDVPQDYNPASAAAVMGDYYPAVKRCTRLSYNLYGHQCRAL